MKIGVMFGDVANSLFRKPITERYPFERNEAPERFRGQLIWRSGKLHRLRLVRHGLSRPSDRNDRD